MVLVSVILIGVLSAVAFVYLYDCNTAGCPGTKPTAPTEELTLQNYAIGYDSSSEVNPTVLTLWVTNLGTGTASISSLAIQVDQGTTTSPFPISVSIPSQTTQRITVDTNGSGFYFAHGHTYGVTVTTSCCKYSFGPISY